MDDQQQWSDEVTGSGTGKHLPLLVEGWCPWKESGPHGDRVCAHLEGHDGDCDMREVLP